VPPDARRRLWTPVYLAGSAACLLIAVRLAPAEHRADALALAAATGALGGANAALVLLGRGRTVLAEVAAMAGVAATAPLVMALAGTPFGPRPAGVGAICLAYFLSTIAFVRTSRRRPDSLAWQPAARTCVAVHVALVLALGAAWWTGWLAPALLVAFVPVLARTAWGLARPTKNLRVLGWREVGVAAAFLAAAGVAVGT
jgi:hypothetical protein